MRATEQVWGEKEKERDEGGGSDHDSQPYISFVVTASRLGSGYLKGFYLALMGSVWQAGGTDVDLNSFQISRDDDVLRIQDIELRVVRS